MSGPLIMKRLLKRIEDETCVCRPAHSPADDAASERVNHEGHMDEALPGRGVRSADALLLPEPYVHLSAHTGLYSSLAQSFIKTGSFTRVASAALFIEQFFLPQEIP
jgi:hypothetical protein